MNKEQITERIGNIDPRLIEGAADVPNYAARRHARMVSRIAGAAAALAIMVGGGFGLGATVFAQEIETPVEVQVEPETITFEDMGVTLILPDSWRGRYGVTEEGYVYALEAHDEYNPAILFWIDLYPEQLTKDEFDNTQGPWNIVPSVYLMTTADGTYCLHCASDVQYDPRDEEATENYVSMYQEISQIRLVLDKAMAE